MDILSITPADNWFGPVGDFEDDGSYETMVGCPWGVGMLKLTGGTFDALMMARNGTRFGGWMLNSFDNRFQPLCVCL